MSIQKEKNIRILQGISIAVCVLGALLCLRHYASGQSLWLDEAYVAFDLMVVSFSDILEMYTVFPLQPRTPMFFQLIVKMLGESFAWSEMALRLWPLTAALLSIGAYYALLKKREAAGITLIALLFFVINPRFIYYAVELKPYTSDILVTLLIYLYFERIRQKNFDINSVRRFAVCTSMALFASFPSVFVSLGIITGLTLRSLASRDLDGASRWFRALLIYSFAFVFLYYIIFNPMITNKYLIGTWSGAFLPYQEGPAASLAWMAQAAVGIFKSPLVFVWPFLGLALALYGAVALLSKDLERSLVLCAPIVICFLAACLNLYPFRDRMLMFLLPNFCVLLAHGLAAFGAKFGKMSPAVVALLAGLLILKPLHVSARDAIEGIRKEDNRALFDYLQRKYVATDEIFYNNSAQYALLYYMNKNALFRQMPWVGSETEDPVGEFKVLTNKFRDLLGEYMGTVFVSYQEEGHFVDGGRMLGMVERRGTWHLDAIWRPGKFQGKRVWLVFSHHSADLRDFVLSNFDRYGQRIDEFKSYQVEVYLYQMNAELK